MDLLSGYNSSESDGDAKESTNNSENEKATRTTNVQATTLRRPPPGALNAAPLPSVPIAVLRSKGVVPGNNGNNAGKANVGMASGSSNNRSLVLMNNPGKGAIHSAVQGPALLCDPNDKATSFIRSIDPRTGSTSKMEANAAIDDYSFSKNRNAFQRGGGYEAALAPGEVAREIQRNDYGHERRFPPNHGTVGNELAVTETTLDSEGNKVTGENANSAEGQIVGQKRTHSPLLDDKTKTKTSRRSRRKNEIASEGALVHNSDDEVSFGIWAPPSASERKIQAESLTAVESGVELDPRIVAERAYLTERDRQRGKLEDGEDNEKEKFDRMVERKMSHLLPPRLEGENPTAIEAKTKFHGQEEVDYRGRSWMSPPSGVKGVDPFDMEDHACYVPKKCVHRFTGHKGGVHRIRLFPRTGHLLLSAGLDGACKVWSVDQRKVMRTYTGHSAAVRDVQFNNDGSKFVSASFDRYLRLWDTESGKVLGTYTNRRVPYVVKFYPHDDNIFVVGCSDNKIVAYDSTTGEITQEYDHHLAPVNTITFVEDHGTKMVTSSDDKKVLVWEWDIGVPIKYISDPTMHSMPVVTMHPSEKFLICQSLDNKIVVYQAGDRYSMQRKKKFDGHNVAGYACDISVSPDGRFVCSGDSDGKLFFWEFKRTKMLQKYHAHDNGPAIGNVWHPVEPSTMFSCGWDGVIKMWQ